jgi:transcriptional regulator with XRE-family HTH domain
METVITRKELGRRLREARETADLKTTPVAAAIGCHPDTIGNYESGTTEPSFRAVAVYSQLTGRTLDWFLRTVKAAA